MDRKLFFSILALTILAIGAANLLPGGKQADTEPKLPWDITIHSEGKLSVFGLTLGESTLGQARKIFQAQGKSNLFLSPSGQFAIESYFQRLSLSGIRADMILTLAIDQTRAKGMFEQGLRISKLGSGAKKVNLSGDDMEQIAHLQIAHITYIPAADLEAELIQGRFGKPSERIREPDSSIEHWLYPEKGLDIALNPDGKEVFQYITPADFERMRAPLKAAAR